LKQALAELRPTDTFNIIAFTGRHRAFSPDALQPATPDNRRAATRWVDRTRLGSGTNLSDALVAALEHTPVTHVFVISDGEPNRGITDPDALRALVRERNRGRAQITTVALGLGEAFPGVALLKALAQENNGTFRYLDLDRR
jgi:Mg-chelatase subunit ChlD